MAHEHDLETVGGRIRFAMVRAGLKQTELAAKMKTSRQVVNRWLNQPKGRPGRATIKKLARVLKVEASWIEYGERAAVSPETETDDFSRGAIHGFAAGLSVGSLGSRPVSPSEARRLLAQMKEILERQGRDDA